MLTHETGIKHVQGKLESFSDSRGSFVFAVSFGGTASVVRSGFGWCAVEFFLFPVDGSALGSSREFSRKSSKKNYARRIIVAARNDFHSLGSRRSHFHRTFFDGGDFFRRVLFDFAVRPGSFRSQKKILTGGFFTAEIICACCLAHGIKEVNF